MATYRYILSAGHRNEDRGGAKREIEWTYPICVKLKKAIERRGGKAWIIQEHDGDNDPSFSHGRGLQNVARLCVDLAKQVGGADAYISMHYEGAAHRIRGFFGIYPDAWSGVDVAANNPLDIKLIKNIAANVAKTGMPIRNGGLMSERSTGVGAQGYRLGEFVGTLGFRDTTARVILEAGQAEHPDDYAMLWSSGWQDKYVEAIVDGLEATFGKFPGSPTRPAPNPTPQPQPGYAKAQPVAQLADKRPFLITEGGSTFVRADLVVKATKATPRLQYASKGSAKIGPDIGAGETFTVDYLILNPDGSLYWYTPWATRVAYEDTEIIDIE